MNSVINGCTAELLPYRILLKSFVFGRRTSSLYTGLLVSGTNFAGIETETLYSKFSISRFSKLMATQMSVSPLVAMDSSSYAFDENRTTSGLGKSGFFYANTV